MKKNGKLNQWLWKWHLIAGLISLPFVLLLSITGAIYLFKADYEAPKQRAIQEVRVQAKAISFQKQWDLAKANAHKKPNGMLLPTADTHAVEFVSGRFGGKTSLFIDPYTGVVTGNVVPRNSLMFKVRKLHGELLMGAFGTKVIELIASWMIVLILTGIYIWWPAKGWRIKGFFVPRFQAGRRVFYRDVHAISGFWFSVLLLMTLAGGMPWTDVFGGNFKWVQQVTGTGYPNTWEGTHLQSKVGATALNLDAMVDIAKALELPGQVQISFPKGAKGVYSVANVNPTALATQQKIHFDQYSGKLIHANTWEDVGVLMRTRMWFMAFHQGEFGRWNWILMLVIAIGLTVLSLAAIGSYVQRKQKESWGIPNVPESFRVDYGILVLVVLLGIVFPLFGISVVFIAGYEKWRTHRSGRASA